MAMDCSKRWVLARKTCATDRCNAIDTVSLNHEHNTLQETPDLAHSLEASVAHLTKNRSDLSDNAPYVSKAEGTNYYLGALSR